MGGSRRPISARTRSWPGAWRLRTLRERPSLRLLRLLLLLMLGLQLGMMAVVLILWLSLIPETLLVQLGRPRRCTLRATTMHTS